MDGQSDMKLSAQQIEQLRDQMSLDPIPDDDGSAEELRNVFGDHTFYVDSDGLYIWEPIESGQMGVQAANAVKVAIWTDDKRAGLVTHDPQPTDIVINFAANDPDPAA